jgi:hypothetical protein
MSKAPLERHAMAFGDYQNEIYLKGLRGVRPKLPVNFAALEEKAAAAFSPTFRAAAAMSTRRTTMSRPSRAGA